jgi:hypothetical protein
MHSKFAKSAMMTPKYISSSEVVWESKNRIILYWLQIRWNGLIKMFKKSIGISYDKNRKTRKSSTFLLDSVCPCEWDSNYTVHVCSVWDSHRVQGKGGPRPAGILSSLDWREGGGHNLYCDGSLEVNAILAAIAGVAHLRAMSTSTDGL